MRVSLVLLLALVALSVSGSAGASFPSQRDGYWIWTEPDVFLNAVGPLNRGVGPTENATLVVGPGQDWVVMMSDWVVSCHDAAPHVGPTVRGITLFDTVVPGSCSLAPEPGGRLHASWSFGTSSGANRAGPMRGDGYFI